MRAFVDERKPSCITILLGERVVISMLRDMAETYGESFNGFSLTKFDGQQIIVG